MKAVRERIGWMDGWLVLWHVNPCWVILCKNKFNNYGLQLYMVQKCIFTIILNWSTFHYLKQINLTHRLVGVELRVIPMKG